MNNYTKFAPLWMKCQTKALLTHYPRRDDVSSSTNLFFYCSAFLKFKSDLPELFWKGAQYTPTLFFQQTGQL